MGAAHGERRADDDAELMAAAERARGAGLYHSPTIEVRPWLAAWQVNGMDSAASAEEYDKMFCPEMDRVIKLNKESGVLADMIHAASRSTPQSRGEGEGNTQRETELMLVLLVARSVQARGGGRGRLVRPATGHGHSRQQQQRCEWGSRRAGRDAGPRGAAGQRAGEGGRAAALGWLAGEDG